MSIRKKRNFRDLQLPVGPGATADADGEPVASRLAPLGPRKRPPPLKENGHGPGDGDLDAGPDATSLQASLIAAASLDPKPQYKEFDLKNDDFNVLEELGQGNGGSVVKVQHVPTGTVMAKKIVLIDAKPAERKKILRELQIMHDCDSPWIVASYGAYLAEPNICICMEFMDKPSFDGIYKRIGAIEIGVVGRVAVAVLEGLRYLYDVHRIIHRDIKPSNILCNSNGDIKLCDFGVSGELVNSIANTFVGTSIYMSPERIQGAPYSVKSDVWSLGITLIELSVGQFPFSGSFDSDEEEDDDPSLLTHSGVEEDGRELPSPPPSPPPKDRDSVQLQLPVRRESLPPRSDSLPAHRDSLPPPSANHNRDSLQVPLSATTKRRNRRRSKGVSLHGSQATLSILELMHAIINEPSPRLPRNKFDKEVEDFVGGCLEKDPEKRGQGGLGALFEYPWIRHSRTNGVDMRAWAATF
ncbi:Pkinase-domain-containing protein [Mycena olivaceomarginata]|nr:Pkinase-domain-containing protein [Mycena olivaceomarginata]